MDSFLIFFIAEKLILQFMFPAPFQTSNKTYKATLKKPVTNIILGSGYNMFLAKNPSYLKFAAARVIH